MFLRVLVVTAVVLLFGRSGPAEALILPPDPFDATDRYALLLPAADGAVTQVQARVRLPETTAPGAGELIAQVRYRLQDSTTGAADRPFRFAVSRAIPLEGLSAAEPQLVTFDFSEYPVPARASARSMTVLYVAPAAVAPQVLAEYSSERLLRRPAGTVVQTELLSSQTAASGTVVVGPITILRERGEPQTETIRFDVPDGSGVFFLRLVNGETNGTKRVTAAVIKVNGQTVFRPAEFSRKVTGLTRQITVGPGENVIEVTIRGEPGAQLTLEVVRQDGRVCRVLGPITFDRVTGKPDTEEIAFEVSPQLSGPFTLRVVNGDDGKRRWHGDRNKDEHRRHRVEWGAITLNGETVIQANDFSGDATEIVRVVTLRTANTLRVKLNGLPGDWITLEIAGFDNIPPVVTIASPESGLVVAAGPITVTGTVDDPSATVTVNGIVASVAPDGTFIAEGVPLQEGDNVIIVMATDSCGNQGEGQVIVRLDTGPAEPPDVLLCAGPYVEAPLEPGDMPDCPSEAAVRDRGTVFGEVGPSAESVQVEGVVLPDGVRINDVGPIDWGLREGTFFSALVWLPEPDGPHPVTVTVSNARGDRAETVTFLRDTVPPVLTVSAPVNPTVTNASTVTITGTVDDPQAELFLVQPGTQRIPLTNGAFTLTVTLPTQQGTSTYWLAAWDPVDNLASVKLSITRDTILPTVNIFSPFAGEYLASRTATVNGVIIDQNLASATLAVNGGAPTALTFSPNAQGGVPFSGVAQFNEGANTFSITAVDKAGNTRVVSTSVTVDTVPPTINLTAPAAGAQLSGVASVTVQAADVGLGLYGVTLLVDGQVRATDFAAPYTFSLDTLTIPAGTRTLTVEASDWVGNSVEATRTVTIRPQMRPQITWPPSGSLQLSSPILVQGTVVNNYGPAEIGITVNGNVAETQGEQFAVDGVELLAGSTTLTATATDGAGVTVNSTVWVDAPTGVGEPSVQLRMISSNRVAPASVTFDALIETAFPVASYQLDFEGDGIPDVTGTTWSQLTTTYSSARLYLPTLTVRDSQGATYTARTVVNVWDAAALDTLLRSKWNAMRDAASVGDLQEALLSFLPQVRDRYQSLFLQIGAALPQALASIEQVHLLAVTDYEVEAEGIRTENGVAYSYPISYQRDAQGFWRFGGF
jgi:hypothetical protein